MRNTLFYIILSLLSSLLLTLSFPKFNLYPAAFIALVPVFYSLLCVKKIKLVALLGFIFGFFFFLTNLYWIPYTRRIDVLGIPALLLLSLVLSCYIILFSIITIILFNRTKRLIIKIFLPAFVWVVIEYLRGIGFYGFPWSSLCYSQYLNLKFIQIADITGMYGVSFLLVLINSTIANFLYHIRYHLMDKRGELFKFTPLENTAPSMVGIRTWSLTGSTIIVLLLIAGTYIYGYIRIKNIDTQLLKNTNKVRVALIQGDIPRDAEWSYEYVNKTLTHYLSLSLPIKDKVDIVIWPETVIPYGDLKDKFLLNSFTNISKMLNKIFIVGCFDEGKKGKYFNTAVVFSEEGKILGKYYKIQLVPWGEVVPLRGLFNLINYNPWGDETDLTPGKEVNVIKTRHGTLSFNICFETIFPYISRIGVGNNSELLVALVADSWFKKDTTYQHTSMATFRCIENRRYLLRCADTGISCFINPYGKIYKKTEPFTQAVIIDEVAFLKDKTFYTTYGDVFVYFCFIFVIMHIIVLLLRRNNIF